MPPIILQPFCLSSNVLTKYIKYNKCQHKSRGKPNFLYRCPLFAAAAPIVIQDCVAPNIPWGYCDDVFIYVIYTINPKSKLHPIE